MVGEGVMHECLQHPDVESVLLINRKKSGHTHPKLTEIIHGDFYDLSPIESQLSGYNACYFCLGVSSAGMKEADYFKLTHTLTLHVAETLCKKNPDMTFCYVSGQGTDSTEKGWTTWARIKGKTENDLMKLPFKHVYNFRPGFIKPTEGLKYTQSYYKYIGWMYPCGRKIYPGGFIQLKEMGLAMINVTLYGYPKQIIEGKDIIALAAQTNKQPAA